MGFKSMQQAIGKQVSIKMKLEEFFPDMVGEGRLSLHRFERLLKEYENASIQVGVERQKLKVQISSKPQTSLSATSAEGVK